MMCKLILPVLMFAVALKKVQQVGYEEDKTSLLFFWKLEFHRKNTLKKKKSQNKRRDRVLRLYFR